MASYINLIMFAVGLACANAAALIGMTHRPNSIAWHDRGSGASADFTCFRSGLADGNSKFVIGHVAQANYNGAENDILVVKIDGNASALAAPTGFWEIWNDRGSGADLDGAVIRPICPNGYVSLGDVMHSAHGCCPAGMENEVRCVKEEYAEEVAVGSVIWADHGSGADQDVQFWGVDGSPGYFYANGNYAYPPSVKFYKLKDSAVFVF